MPRNLLFIIILTITILSCSKETINTDKIITINTVEQVIPKETTPPIKEETKVKKVYDLNILSNTIEFSSLDLVNIESKEYAVVANDNTKLYNFISLQKNSDTDNLEEINKLELGSIIPINKIIMIEDTIHDNYFKFNGNNNYFYETEINEKQAIVWGADLLVNIKDPKEASKISYLYTKKIRSDTFLPFNGEYNLKNKNISDLSNNSLAFEDIEIEDTMINLYKHDSKIRSNTIFITTDLLTNSLTNLFKEFITVYQEDVLNPGLNELINDLLVIIERYKNDDEKNSTTYSELLIRTQNYFLLTKLLLDDSENLKSNMPQIVMDEYKLIIEGNGYSISPILNYSNDYSIYAGNNNFSNSFKWLTNSNIDIRMSLLMNKIMKENLDLFDKWNNLAKDFKYINGDTIDLEFNKTLSMVDDYVFSIFPSWIEEDKNIKDFIIKYKLSNETFSFFGKPFNLDDNILKSLSAEQITDRINSNNLDIMSLFGSKTAKSLINQNESDKSYWNDYQKAEKNVNEMILSKNDSYWSKTYYNNFLNLIKSISTFEQRKEFNFTEKGKWNQKTLFTSHGALTELKSIFIKNYIVENTVVEDEEPSDITYDTNDYLRPIHYVEPNREFFILYNLLLKEVINNFNFEIISKKYSTKFEQLLDISTELLKIVENEIIDLPISEKQNEYISTVPTQLSRIVRYGAPVLLKINNSYMGTGLPRRLFIALDDDQGGKRVATGYTYSYYEFMNEESTPISQEEWVTNLYDTKQDIESIQPFWANDSVK